MRFIRKWSYTCADHLAAAVNENHQRRSVYYYGFYIVYGAVFKLAVLITAALILNILIPTLILFFAFGSLRMFAGGVHMDSFGKCMVVSYILFLSGAALSEYTYMYWSTQGLFIFTGIALLAGVCLLLKYAPKDTPNKPITDPDEIIKFKRLSIIYLFVLISVITVLEVLDFDKFAIPACLGIYFELFSITPLGHSFFYRINNVIK